MQYCGGISVSLAWTYGSSLWCRNYTRAKVIIFKEQSTYGDTFSDPAVPRHQGCASGVSLKPTAVYSHDRPCVRSALEDMQEVEVRE